MSNEATIEICSSVHTYERRHCWMLSSIVQQEEFDLGRIRVCSAYIEGTGEPTCREVLQHFRTVEPRIDWHDVPYPDDTIFRKRGNVRNRHVEESEADWIFFADADIVLPPEFLKELMGVLSKDGFRDFKGCLYGGRFSTLLEPTEAIVDAEPGRYPCEIYDVWEEITSLPAVRKSNIGAGYMHIVNGKWMREERGYYVPPGKAADWDWDRKHSRCRSDQQFRRDVEKKKLPVPWIYHVQHKRDKDFGRHVKVQR